MFAPRPRPKHVLGVVLCGILAWTGCSPRREWTGKANQPLAVEVHSVDAENAPQLGRRLLAEYQTESKESASRIAQIDADDTALRRFASELDVLFNPAPYVPRRSAWTAEITERRHQLQSARSAALNQEPALVHRLFESITNAVVRSDATGAFRWTAAPGDWIAVRPDPQSTPGSHWPVWLFPLDDSMKSGVVLDSSRALANATQLVAQLARLSKESAPSESNAAASVGTSPALMAWMTETRANAAAEVSNSVQRIASIRSAITAPHAVGDSISIPLEGGRTTNAVTLTVRWIPAGRFTMGSPPDEKDRDRDETLHTVLLNRGFYLAETECTQAQWLKLSATNRSGTRGDSLPVTQVTWTDAHAYCQQLTAWHRQLGLLPAGWKWDLPTEAQWEYACRAGTTGLFAGEFDEIAWHAGNSKGRLQPVKTRRANAWGLHDLHGNVAEWCQDWYADYPVGLSVDPVGPETGKVRIYRGGNLIYGARRSRSAVRGAFSPGLRGDYLGFRVALVQEP